MSTAEKYRETNNGATDRHAVLRFYLMVLIFALFTLVYYFGELIDFANWDALKSVSFFFGVHDIHRLLFLVPILYAGYYFGVKPAIIVTILAVGAFLPRALFLSPYPDPLLRTALFTIIAAAVGYLFARARTGYKRSRRLVARLQYEKNELLEMFNAVRDGILLTGPDYKVRFTNSAMVKAFGEGLGSHCYQYLNKSDKPCPQICKLQDVLNGKVERLKYRFPDGRNYDVLVSPYVGINGEACQLSTFREMTQADKPQTL